MKKLTLISSAITLAASAALTACSNSPGDANVTINLPEGFPDKTLVVSHVVINDFLNATQQDDIQIIYDTLKVVKGVAKMNLDPAGPARYNIVSPEITMREPDFYASPSDTLEITIKSFNPVDFSVKGSKLMEDLSVFNSMTIPIQEEYVKLINSTDSVVPVELSESILNRYADAVKKFVVEHPESQALPLAITELDSDDFNTYYANMSPAVKESILMPYAELYKSNAEEMQEQQKAEEDRKAELASGKVAAPNFTLPDLDGKKVSLSDFRGKWVVLDFWGSWCGWCVKGFPALKEAYNKYGDKIVVIGIDCNESEEDWRGGVERHQLPWINLYNGLNEDIYNAYNITGFPTKAIINPQGKLVDLTTGDDPSFYTRLASFINGK